MRLLITGRGTSGSWAIRGTQLGAAIGATVLPRATGVRDFDAVVIVKRDSAGTAAAAHRAGVPVIWDVVDGWNQPAGNDWPREHCLAWLRGEVAMMRPAGIVAATQAMAVDCREFGLPVLALPHHARPGLAQNPIRERVAAVGYEGAEHYLGRWAAAVARECARRGWRFVINPPALADVDIVVALREADGYAPRNWKSAVKLSNAQGSGTPFVGVPECGYMEQSCGAELFVADAPALARAFDALTPHAVRRRAADAMRAAAPRIEDIASIYRGWLEGVVERQSACCG